MTASQLAHVSDRSDGRTDGENWTGNWQGKPYGAGVSIILEDVTGVSRGLRAKIGRQRS
jgi:hypothetical protein